MKIKLPRWAAGDRMKAADLNLLSEAIERLANITLDGTHGLQIEESAAGWKLSYIPRPLFGFAVVTGADIPAYDPDTKVDGKGAGTLDLLTYSSSGTCTHSDRTPERAITIYNGGLEPVFVGDRVAVYEESPGHWHIIVRYCPVS